MHSNHWVIARIALFAACVFLAWFAFRRFRSREQRAPIKKRILDLGWHLVALLDVQGQRERFGELRLPKSPEDAETIGEALRQTAGFVLDLREAFDEQFENFEAGATSLMRRHTQEPVRPKFFGFSDSFVASVPLRNDGGDLLPIARVFSALSAAAVVTLMSLASKHPLRGGVDVGLATDIGLQEIYGPVLGSAYRLESKEAGYPRVVIGDELWRTNDTGCAGCCGDYAEIAGPGGGQKDVVVRRAYDFVLAEQKRVVKEKNSKLIPRYGALRRYVESRLPLWGIEVKKD